MERLKIKEEIFNFLKGQVGGLNGYNNGSLQYRSIEIMGEDKNTGDPNLKWEYYDVLGDFFQSGILVNCKGGEFFVITKKGGKYLEEDNFDIFDPESYLRNFEKVDEVTKFYLSEAIHSFNKDLHLSSIMALGVASESLMLNLAELLFRKIDDKKGLEIINSKYSIFKLIKRINEQCMSKEIKNYREKYEIAVMSFSNIIREYRNDYNHPKKSEISNTLVYSLLYLFKEQYKKITELKKQILLIKE